MTIVENMNMILSVPEDGINYLNMVIILAFPLISDGAHVSDLSTIKLQPPFPIDRHFGRQGGNRVLLNNHLSLSRGMEQVHLRQELSLQWGETQSWHCFSFLKQLNKVVASTVSKLGQELITKSSWHRVGFSTSKHWDKSTKPVGIPFIMRA